MTTSSEQPYPPYLLAMACQRPPHDAYVVPGSTAVVAFGDPTRAEVATLGINPSKVEFLDNAGALLSGDHRRLATVESLGLQHEEPLSELGAFKVIRDCETYFQRQPYMRWFGPLDLLMREAIDASYLDGSACHLDLVPWATDPIWGQIEDAGIRRSLLDDGMPFLREQLRRENLRLLLLNGRTVLTEVQRCGLVELTSAGELRFGDGKRCFLYEGRVEGVRVLGWSTNLQSSFGVTRELKTELAVWINSMLTPLVDEPAPAAVDTAGYISRGTEVTSKTAFAALLRGWLTSSDCPTIGDVGTYGGSACVHLRSGDDEVVLNADTKRAAVQAYLDDVQARGAEAPWHVVANRRGRVNKVVYRADAEPSPGWFGYLVRDLDAPRAI